MKKIIIGARGSKLSLAYVSKVKSLILASSKDVDIHIKPITTSGDIHQNIKLSEIGGKNYVKEPLSKGRGRLFKYISRDDKAFLNVSLGRMPGADRSPEAFLKQ